MLNLEFYRYLVTSGVWEGIDEYLPVEGVSSFENSAKLLFYYLL